MLDLDKVVAENGANGANGSSSELKAGVFAEYDSRLDYPEIKGYRIAKFLGRASKQGEKAESKYCYVPTRHINADSVAYKIEELMPHIITWLQSVEDEDIKKELKKGALSYFTEKLDIDYVISLLVAKSTSGRLSGEQIENWFMAECKAALQIAFADKLGFGSDLDSLEVGQTLKLEQIAKVYADKFKSLASPKVILPDDEIIALQKVLALVAESETSLKLKARLEVAAQKEVETLEML